ncbi:MAG: IS21-like element helper ATPase IstB [Candidatus Aminicenantes bacterium]|nr:MAG: IS21-like element helper ATPase IstB [Candidatus Aminicenantes bacterium]
MKEKLCIRSQLEESLKELHLSTIKDSFEKTAKLAIEESFSYEEYLLELLDQEKQARSQRRIERLLKESKLPLEKSLSCFDKSRLPQKIKYQLNQLLQGDFINQKENVLAFGNPGTGKTHLLCGIGQELIFNGYKVYFAKCSLLVQDLLIAKKNLELAKIIKKLSKYEVIIIDDIGYVQQTRDEMEVLFTLLAERYEKGSVMITSNIAFSKWENIFKDPMLAAAAIDRLIHHCTVIELNIPSYRIEQARKRKEAK